MMSVCYYLNLTYSIIKERTINKKEEKEMIHIWVKCSQVSAALRLQSVEWCLQVWGVRGAGTMRPISGSGCLRLTPCPLLSLMKARTLGSWSRPGPGDSALLSARSVPIITSGHKHWLTLYNIESIKAEKTINSLARSLEAKSNRFHSMYSIISTFILYIMNLLLAVHSIPVFSICVGENMSSFPFQK